MKHLLAAGLAALLAGCSAAPTAADSSDSDRYHCTYPGAAAQCRGLNSG